MSELAAAAARRARFVEVCERLDEAEREHERLRLLAERWRREVGVCAERLDAQRGVFALLRGLFGNGGDRADLERRLAEARERHDDADGSLAELERQRDALRRERDELADAPATYAELLADKERRLRAAGGDLARRLDESAERLLALDEECELLARVVRLARDAEGELMLVKQCLQLASSAAHVDVMGGGVSLVSTPQLRDAERHADAARRHLEQLEGDLERHAAVLGRIRFTDDLQLSRLFRCGLSIDFGLIQRIVASSHEVVEVIDRVRQGIWEAEKQLKRLQTTACAARDERAVWIEHADG
ncbi:MAG: hypothetical protein KAI24_26465 [Planctomycetes bacterium]|nr:hypothetical protein [Planctomycetota bacterium]